MLLDFVWLLYFNEAIKTNPSKAKKPRNTSAKQILGLAESDDHDASFEAKRIADYGRKLSDREYLLRNLRLSRRRFTMSLADRSYIIALSPNQKDATRELSRTEQMSAFVAASKESLESLGQLFGLK